RGMTARVIRGVRVLVIADGERMSVLTQPVTVAEVLRRAGVRLGSRDLVTPSLQDVVRENTEIRVTRVLERVERERFEIPVPVERVADSSLERGRMRLVRPGKPGEGERLVKVTYVDGKPSLRQVLQERVISPPVSRLIAFGTLDTVYRGGAVLRFRSALEMVATAYSARTGKRTATGALVRYGVAAVDPRVIPLGTRLYVEGYGYATALDVGSSIKGNRIDLFFPSESECDRWGRRVVRVYILE
ncbi:MAG: 3D domain-containing protein, partial [Thermacetogeniaceae bacterium]